MIAPRVSSVTFMAMSSDLGQPGPTTWKPRLLFVVSAMAAALALRMAWDEPFAGLLGLLFLTTLLVSRWLSRRRVHRLLRSGDVDSVLDRWSGSIDRVPHAETMGPLMTATAFAAYGWVDRAREILRTAQRGPAWEAAIEHRLFLDALLLIFEGNSDDALEKAERLERLPLPTAMPFLMDRVRVLRHAVGALARAFSHNGEQGYRSLLLKGSDSSPLVYWAMRYGAAILAIDAGDLKQAHELISGAPSWPTESCFGTFHKEIAEELQRRLVSAEG